MSNESGARFQRPHLGWWISILLGMTLTGVLALSGDVYALWTRHVTTMLSQGVIQWIFGIAVLLHVGEAAFAWWLCRVDALRSHRVAWTLQTLLLGFPSTRLVLAEARRGTAQ